ncbi:MAG: 3-coathanger stack domain-containing protein [Bacteroidota bacterium]
MDFTNVTKFICGLFMILTMSGAAQVVTIFDMQYDNGTPIPLGGTIEVEEGGQVGISFVVLVDQLDQQGGTLRVFTQPEATFPRVQRASTTVFSGQHSFSWTVSLTVQSNWVNQNETGLLFAEFEKVGGLTYLSGDYFIDVIESTECTLSYPSGRTTTNITSNSATVNWNTVSGNSGYNSEYRQSGSSSWTTISTSSSSTSQNISGLSSSTSYQWRVRTRCSNGEYGDWSPTVGFTTSGTCSLPAVTGLSSTNVTDISADISWNNLSGASSYQVQQRVLPGGSFVTVLSNFTGTSSTLSNLSPETSYEWRVRGRCSNGIYTSNWSNPATFTTEPECVFDLPITENVNAGETDIEDAENSITATNIIFNSGTAEYDAGNIVILSPGFRAESGSQFRGYIDGCTPPGPKGISKSATTDPIVPSLDDVKKLSVYPNPTKGMFALESKDELQSWEITNQFGSLYRKGEADLKDGKKAEVNISDFPTGVYFLKATFKDGEVLMKTVIRE